MRLYSELRLWQGADVAPHLLPEGLAAGHGADALQVRPIAKLAREKDTVDLARGACRAVCFLNGLRP